MKTGDTVFIYRNGQIDRCRVLDVRPTHVHLRLPAGNTKRVGDRKVFTTFAGAKEYALDISTGHLNAAKNELEKRLREHRRIEALTDRAAERETV